MAAFFSNETEQLVDDRAYNAGRMESERRDLQSRVDELLCGRVGAQPGAAPRRRLFAAFATRDQQAASALAAAWMNMADKEGGLPGLRTAVDHMYRSLEDEEYPLGLVQYAVAHFLTHYEPARMHLVVRRIEELQPNLVRPSEERLAVEKRRLIANL